MYKLSWYKLLVAAVCFSPLTSFAKSIVIFDVKKSLALKSNQKTYFDYYINAGTDAGIKRGMVFTVVRQKTLYDAYQNTSPGEIPIPVGEIKVIFSHNKISVARLEALYSRDNLPVLDYEYILVGDRIDVSSARKAKKRKTAEKKLQKTKSKKASPKKVESVTYSSRLPDPDVFIQ